MEFTKDDYTIEGDLTLCITFQDGTRVEETKANKLIFKNGLLIAECKDETFVCNMQDILSVVSKENND